MRPVKKWGVGQEYIVNDEKTDNVLERYDPHRDANSVLQLNLGSFCSYCEVFSSDLEVEHVISKQQDPSKITEWDNFLVSCGRCNGRDNKFTKPVDLDNIYLPHLHNTLLVFEYKEGGLVSVHPELTHKDQIAKANALMNLVCLDKYPGNPKYPATREHPMGFSENDKRWEHRRKAWEYAKRKLYAFEKGEIDAKIVTEFAEQRGFFSVWFSVFHAHPEVKKALVSTFKGTETTCFDPITCNPIPRHPSNIFDPI